MVLVSQCKSFKLPPAKGSIKVEKRLACWLLLAQDRIDSETLKITHDFLATMLGADQPSVTLA